MSDPLTRALVHMTALAREEARRMPCRKLAQMGRYHAHEQAGHVAQHYKAEPQFRRKTAHLLFSVYRIELAEHGAACNAVKRRR